MATIAEDGKPGPIEIERALLEIVRRGKEPSQVTDRSWDIVAPLGITPTAYDRMDTARRLLFESQSELVNRMAMRFRRYHRYIPKFAFISAGEMACLQAIEEFDLERNHSFGAFAQILIRHAMSELIPQEAFVVRIPKRAFQIYQRWDRAKNNLMVALGRTPTFEEILEAYVKEVRETLAKELGREPVEQELQNRLPSFFKSPSRLRNVLRKIQNAMILSASLGGETSPFEWASAHERTARPSGIVSSVIGRLESEALSRALAPNGSNPAVLTEEERNVIVLRTALWAPGEFFYFLKRRFNERLESSKEELFKLALVMGLRPQQISQVLESHVRIARSIKHLFGLSENAVIPRDPRKPSALERLGGLLGMSPDEVEERLKNPLHFNQVAILLDRPKGGVRNSYYQGREKLRVYLDGHPIPAPELPMFSASLFKRFYEGTGAEKGGIAALRNLPGFTKNTRAALSNLARHIPEPFLRNLSSELEYVLNEDGGNAFKQSPTPQKRVLTALIRIIETHNTWIESVAMPSERIPVETIETERGMNEAIRFLYPGRVSRFFDPENGAIAALREYYYFSQRTRRELADLLSYFPAELQPLVITELVQIREIEGSLARIEKSPVARSRIYDFFISVFGHYNEWAKKQPGKITIPLHQIFDRGVMSDALDRFFLSEST